MKILTAPSVLQNYMRHHKLEGIFDDHLCSLLQMHQYAKGEQIIQEATDVTCLYLVLEGEAKVSPSSIDGKLGLLEFVMVKDVIGALEHFSGDQFYHSVFAVSPCTVLAIPISMIDQQLGNSIHFYKFICENLAHIMKRTSVRYSSALLYPLKNRLAKYLYEKYVLEDTDEIVLLTTQTAEYFGVTSRHLRRIVAGLENERIVLREKNLLRVLDMEQLKDYATFM